MLPNDPFRHRACLDCVFVEFVAVTSEPMSAGVARTRSSVHAGTRSSNLNWTSRGGLFDLLAVPNSTELDQSFAQF
jgi:hypothetical protein